MQIPLLSPWVGRRVDQWSAGAQQRSRRNAMIASTRLAQQRAERLEVQDFLEELHHRNATRTEVVRVAVGH
jgi:hypothetical protein